ncbi:MAG TPA: DNA primase [Longimicrobiales bacterium]|nr:DNA primase [Longimicrobiales bacterium]
MIPDGVVEEVRERADIVEVIGELVSLKRAGKDFKGLCPFHQEKTPSFYVVPAKGFYKCFGCGESGDVFSFLMKHLGLGFQEAVEKLAARYGVEIPAQTPQEDDGLQPLREAVAFAADFYQQHLLGPAGERARSYLAGRGIAEDAWQRFMLGYAPDEWRALREAAGTHGMEDEVLEAAGLIKRSEKVEEPYDRFRDRIIFPITERGGRVVAFGGRVLGGTAGNAPKYLNSPEGALYHKGSILYGLHWAKGAIRREEAALVVEGYMDYVSLAARGVENVVAGLGTAMTEEQAALLARYTRQALLLYDSDAAGLRATFRSGDALLRAGVHPLVVTLPPGEDPDSLVRAGGAASLRPYLDDAVDVLDRKLQILEERAYFEDVEGTRKALDGLLPTLRAAADPALRDIYIDRVARRTGVRRETLEREARGGDSGSGHPAARAVRDVAQPEPAVRTTEAAERKLLLLLVRDRGRVPQAAELLRADAFRHPTHRALFQALTVAGAASSAADLELDPAARALLERLAGEEEDLGETDRVFWETVERIRLRPLLERYDELTRLMQVAGEQDVYALMAEKMELERRIEGKMADLQKLGGTTWPRFRKYLKNRPS